MKKQRVNKKILYMTQMAILIAIIVLMAFTPIGYIKTAGLEITLITIPVIIGAIVMGPAAGAVLGGVFGITSFLQAALGLSAFGTLMMEISPAYCAITCFIPRILMGLLTGIVWNVWKKKDLFAYSITSLAGALFNTVFFMSFLIICYWHTDFLQGIASSLGTTEVFAFIVAFVGLNGVVEAVSCFIIAAAISRAVNAYLIKE